MEEIFQISIQAWKNQGSQRHRPIPRNNHESQTAGNATKDNNDGEGGEESFLSCSILTSCLLQNSLLSILGSFPPFIFHILYSTRQCNNLYSTTNDNDPSMSEIISNTDKINLKSDNDESNINVKNTDDTDDTINNENNTPTSAKTFINIQKISFDQQSTHDANANNQSISIANNILHVSHSKTKPFTSSSTSTNQQMSIHQITLILNIISQLLRACKNMIRCNRVVEATGGSISRQHQQQQQSQQQQQRKRHGSSPNYTLLDPARRLCSVGMTKIYLTLLQLNCPEESLYQDIIASSAASNNHYNHDVCNSNASSNTTSSRDDLAWNASLALFYATYGPAKESSSKRSLIALLSTSQRRDVGGGAEIGRQLISDPARSSSVFRSNDGDDGKSSSDAAAAADTSTALHGITILMRLLTSCVTTVPVILGLVRNIHNITGSVPGIVSTIDHVLSLQEQEDELPTNSNMTQEEKCGKVTTGTTIQEEKSGVKEEASPSSSSAPPMKRSLLTVLVTILAWTIRSEPSFPGSENDSTDRRFDLVIEILRVMFAVQCSVGTHHNGSGSSSSSSSSGNGNGNAIEIGVKQLESENPEAMTQLGILLIDILLLPNRDRRSYECKLGVLNLLMDYSRPEYGQFLLVNGAIQSLLTILWLQLNNVLVERIHLNQEEKAAAVLPILIVLQKFSQGHAGIKDIVKSHIFPPCKEVEEKLAGKMSIQKEEVKMDSNASVAPDGHDGVNDAKGKHFASKNMKPLDAPEDTLRWKLIELMTWTDSNVKRCASELLWTLCENDSNEFIIRVGFGNAVHFLSIKGFLKIPEQSSIDINRVMNA